MANHGLAWVSRTGNADLAYVDVPGKDQLAVLISLKRKRSTCAIFRTDKHKNLAFEGSEVVMLVRKGILSL